MSMKVAVRHRNGKINHYVVNNTTCWKEARDYTLEQVPTARVVMAVIDGGDRRAKPAGPTAA